LGSSLSRTCSAGAVQSLSCRERQISLMVAKGLSNKEVGYRLGLSEATVKSHLHSIYKKMQIDNRSVLTRMVMAQAETEPSPPRIVQRLTPRERQVFVMVAEGAANRDIARRLILSEGTVKIHLHTIFRKIGVHSRAALTALAIAQQSLPGCPTLALVP